MADVNTVINAANDLFRQIPGIVKVFSEAPDVGPSADLPCVIPVSSTIDQSDGANGLQRKDYTVKFLLLVTPYNKNLPAMEKKARPFGDPVLDLFYQHGCLDTDPETIDNSMMSSGGYDQITYNETQDYLGWIFTLRATVKNELERNF